MITRDHWISAADHAKNNEKLYKTQAYWKLNDLQYE